jgi:transcription elongation factor GreA
MREDSQNVKILISRHGYEELVKRLEYLKTIKRAEISEKIKHSITFGDLSENAEYDSAKQEQAFLESEIADIEAQIARAEIINEKEVGIDKVNVGCKVELRNVDKKTKVTYYITGPLEADPDNSRISWISPVGQGLMGHKIGDVVEITVPKGKVRFKIMKIERGKNE